MHDDTGSCARIPLLGGEIEVVLYGIGDSLAQAHFDDIRREGLRLQRIFSFYDRASELSVLNRERSLDASPEMLGLVRMCLPWCRLTRGEYDIARGKEISMRKSRGTEARSGASYRDIGISGSRISLANPDALVDLGSAAKGYIGDRLCSLIRDQGIESAYLDMRGDLIFFGPRTETIEVQHPREPGRRLLSFQCRDSAVATSGDYKQFIGSHERSHIINSKDICSATVVSSSLAEADIAATCILVSGASGLSRFSGMRYIAVDKGMGIHSSGGLA